MYQVTAMYGNEEVGYGYAESYEDAASEAAGSVLAAGLRRGEFYAFADVVLVCSHGALTVRTPLDLWFSVGGCDETKG